MNACPVVPSTLAHHAQGRGTPRTAPSSVPYPVGADLIALTRSAAERAAGESIWVPTALLPGSGTHWSAPDEGQLTVDIAVDGHAVRLHHHIDERGRIRTSTLERWGDPDNCGTWALHPFGVEVSQHRTFAGVTIPAVGRAGWHFGTDRWESGVFFRYEITEYRLIPPER